MLIKYNNEIKTKLTLKKLMVLLILLASQGMINVSQKMYTTYVYNGNKHIFNFYTFIITLAVLIVCKIICMLKKTPHSRQGRMIISGKDIMYIFIMSAMLYVNSFCLTYATEYIPSVVLYPLNGVLQFAG